MPDKQPLSAEELMKLRWKVIADYPGNFWSVGDIVPHGIGLAFGKFPAIFQPLPWYAERDKKDIEAVKFVKDRFGRVFEILTWIINGEDISAGITVRPFIIDVPHLFPATEAEYTAFTNDKKK